MMDFLLGLPDGLPLWAQISIGLILLVAGGGLTWKRLKKKAVEAGDSLLKGALNFFKKSE